MPLDDAKTYRVATNDFMARGGDGYSMFRDGRALLPIDDSPILANEVIEFVGVSRHHRTGIEGRRPSGEIAGHGRRDCVATVSHRADFLQKSNAISSVLGRRPRDLQ